MRKAKINKSTLDVVKGNHIAYCYIRALKMTFLEGIIHKALDNIYLQNEVRFMVNEL
ncbi:MAG: hypothetical protein ACRCXT_07995 [Paraclostridium sp.]